MSVRNFLLPHGEVRRAAVVIAESIAREWRCGGDTDVAADIAEAAIIEVIEALVPVPVADQG